MPTITVDKRTEDVRTMTPATQQAVAVELAGRACARSREGKRWAALKNIGKLTLVALFASGCATGDWIIRGVKGELHPCRDDIFRATYEAVE